jgi:hypothetical protein
MYKWWPTLTMPIPASHIPATMDTLQPNRTSSSGARRRSSWPASINPLNSAKASVVCQNRRRRRHIPLGHRTHVTSAIATSSRIGLPGRFCTFLPPRYRTAPSRSAITKLKFTPMYNIKPAVSPPKGSVEGLPRAMRPGEDRNDTSETRGGPAA